MANINIKKLVITALPLVVFFCLADKAGQAFRLSAGADASTKILHLSGGFQSAFANPLLSLKSPLANLT